MTDHVIQYLNHGTVNGEPVGRVYVRACPEIGPSIFSYTKDPQVATRWPSRDAAYKELAGHFWTHAEPVALESATVLP